MVKQRETHSRVVAEVREFWWTESLWAAAAELPVVSVRIDDIAEFDQNCWFGDTPPPCREVAEHARSIEAADVKHPVILNANGGLVTIRRYRCTGFSHFGDRTRPGRPSCERRCRVEGCGRPWRRR